HARRIASARWFGRRLPRQSPSRGRTLRVSIWWTRFLVVLWFAAHSHHSYVGDLVARRRVAWRDRGWRYNTLRRTRCRNRVACRIHCFHRVASEGRRHCKFHFRKRDDRLQVRRRSLSCQQDRKSTRLNSSHLGISYAVFCLKKKKKKN